jgi:hypothetical protein
MIESIGNWRSGVLIPAALLAVVCGSATPASTSNAAVVVAANSGTLHFYAGRQSLSFQLHEPAGVILLYRLSAPRQAKVRGSAQLPRITVPLRIATGPTGPSGSCTTLRARITCTVGEEWCPMPEGTWRFRVEKLGGPAGDVIVAFHIGTPPGGRAA